MYKRLMQARPSFFRISQKIDIVKPHTQANNGKARAKKRG
jgi:hypothetical protein